MRPRIQGIVDGIIDRVASRGHMDIIDDFAFRLPVIVICDMLGIPEDHREMFFAGSRASGRLLDPTPLSPAEIAEQNVDVGVVAAGLEVQAKTRAANAPDTRVEAGKTRREERIEIGRESCRERV